MVGLMRINRHIDAGNYIEIFNNRYTQYGGHWQSLSYIINTIVWFLSWYNMSFDYFGFGIFKNSMFGYDCTYYDGNHHSLHFGRFHFGWGGGPYMFGDVELIYESKK